MENQCKGASTHPTEDHVTEVVEVVVVVGIGEEDADAVVVEEGILDVRRKDRKLKKEVIGKRSRTPNPRRSRVDKDKVITVDEVAAVVEVGEAVTVDVDAVARDLETSPGLIRIMKAIVPKVIAITKTDLNVVEAIPADDQEGSDDDQDVHQHRVQVTRVVIIVITIAAGTNIMAVVMVVIEAIVAIVEIVEIVEIVGIEATEAIVVREGREGIEVVMENVMVTGAPEEGDMVDTEKSSKVKMVIQVARMTGFAR